MKMMFGIAHVKGWQAHWPTTSNSVGGVGTELADVGSSHRTAERARIVDGLMHWILSCYQGKGLLRHFAPS